MVNEFVKLRSAGNRADFSIPSGAFMARLDRRTFKRLYRKEPISSFLILMGVIELVIGGVDGQWSLFSLGLGLVLGAIAVRWSKGRKNRLESQRVLPRRYLPPSESVNAPLPQFVKDQRR